MKIHTTQNLNSPVINSTNNIVMPKNLRYSMYSSMSSNDSQDADTFKSTSFKGKKSALKKAVEAGKKTFAERVADKEGIKKLLNSDSFGKALEFTGEQEVMIQAGTALAICCGLRPLTIMAIPGDKNKKDCAYASAHSFSSGVFGFIVPFLFIKPLANGYNHAKKEAGKYIIDDAKLQEMWPHLDIESTKGADGIRKPVEDWLDTQKHKFIPDIKDVRKVPLPKHISEISEETLKNKIKDLDVSKIKNKSVNEWVTTDGKKINFKFEDIFVAVQEDGKKNAKYYQLMHMDEKLLQEIYPDLDMKSVKINDIKRNHPDLWKNTKGEDFKFDYDSVFISDWNETDKAITFITGKTRQEGKEVKDICYQKNNNIDDIWDKGTEITAEMVESNYVNTVLDKLGGWLPDIVVAYPRATATIAVIPFVLKNVLGIEKSKKPAQPQAQETRKVGA